MGREPTVDQQAGQEVDMAEATSIFQEFFNDNPESVAGPSSFTMISTPSHSNGSPSIEVSAEQVTSGVDNLSMGTTITATNAARRDVDEDEEIVDYA